MRIEAAPVTPARVERESQLRLESIVTADVEVTTSPPWWAFTPNDRVTRPSTWSSGRWRDGTRTIAQSPVIGQSLLLTPESYRAWLRVDLDGERHVLDIGPIRVR